MIWDERVGIGAIGDAVAIGVGVGRIGAGGNFRGIRQTIVILVFVGVVAERIEAVIGFNAVGDTVAIIVVGTRPHFQTKRRVNEIRLTGLHAADFEERLGGVNWKPDGRTGGEGPGGLGGGHLAVEAKRPTGGTDAGLVIEARRDGLAGNNLAAWRRCDRERGGGETTCHAGGRHARTVGALPGIARHVRQAGGHGQHTGEAGLQDGAGNQADAPVGLLAGDGQGNGDGTLGEGDFIQQGCGHRLVKIEREAIAPQGQGAGTVRRVKRHQTRCPPVDEVKTARSDADVAACVAGADGGGERFAGTWGSGQGQAEGGGR